MILKEEYERHQGVVFRFALQMSGSTAVAEDVTQEVFLYMMENPDRYNPERGSLPSFLLGIARNFVLQSLRKQSRVVELNAEAEVAMTQTPLTQMIQSERMRRMKSAILSLPEDYREVIVLCELSELSYEEAAAVLDCAVGTVRSRLHRARNLLLRKLGIDRAEEKEPGGKAYELPVV